MKLAENQLVHFLWLSCKASAFIVIENEKVEKREKREKVEKFCSHDIQKMNSE